MLIKGGEALQRAGDVTTVVLDKTGTITEGRPTVTDVLAGPRRRALERGSPACAPWPRSSAARSTRWPTPSCGTPASGIALGPPEDFESVTGRGAVGVVDGRAVAAGNARLMADYAVDAGPAAGPSPAAHRGGTHAGLVAALDGRLAGAARGRGPAQGQHRARRSRGCRRWGSRSCCSPGDNRPHGRGDRPRGGDRPGGRRGAARRGRSPRSGGSRRRGAGGRDGGRRHQRRAGPGPGRRRHRHRHRHRRGDRGERRDADARRPARRGRGGHRPCRAAPCGRCGRTSSGPSSTT